MNSHRNNEDKKYFLKIPKEDWKYEIESGKITWEEHAVEEWLWFKANTTTGKVVINYTILAEEMKGRFDYTKDVVNKITKIMNSLKKKQRLWFPEHSGSKSKVEVELHGYPLIQGGYTDISYRFQQNSSRGETKTIPKDTNSPAELLKDGQRLKKLESQKSKLINSMSIDSPGRAPKIDKKNIRKIDKSKNNNFNNCPLRRNGENSKKEAWKDQVKWEKLVKRAKR